MEDSFPRFLLMLILVLAAARCLGRLAQWIGQPAVLGELIAGILLGPSVLGQVKALSWASLDPANKPLHLLAELGVVVLLFEIGLETDFLKLLAVGGASTAVAVVGVVLPFVLGFAACRLLSYDAQAATVAGATLTATSVGITARVLADLNQLQATEGRIILGAAVVDDILGLILLAVITAWTGGQYVSLAGLLRISALAFGFVAAALLAGWWLQPAIARLAERFRNSATLALWAFLFALALAYLADVVQTGLVIVGAFAAGLVLARLPQVHAIQRGFAPIGQVFVPIFFVATGAVVDVRLWNPWNAANHTVLAVSGLLLLAAVTGKFAAGYAPVWYRGRKSIVGIGMIPRGEVGLIFATVGMTFVGQGLFNALMLVIVVTTLIVPPLLKHFFAKA